MDYKHNAELTNVAKNLRKNMTKEEKHLFIIYEQLKLSDVHKWGIAHYKFINIIAINRFNIDSYK